MRAMLPHTEGTVDRDGIGLHYEIYGSGDHTIVFVPTWAIVHSRVWKAQIPYFAEHFRVIAYDPRGNGQSGRPATADGYSVDRIDDFEDAFSAALASGRPTLIDAQITRLALPHYSPNPEGVLAGVFERFSSRFGGG